MLYMLLPVVLSVQASSAPATASAEQVGRGYYFFLQGMSLEAANDVPGAIESYRQASLALPESAEIRTALAGLYARQQQMAEAKREAEAALAIDPDNRPAHRILGGIETSAIENASGDASPTLLTSAIGHLEHVVAGGPLDPPVELALASLYLRAQRPDAAIQRLGGALDQMPDYMVPSTLRLLIRAHEAAGHADEGAALRARLSAGRPDSVERAVRDIDRLERGGRWSDAAAQWARIFDDDPGAAIYRTRYAAALANSRRPQEARQVLLDATRETPRDSAAWYLLAVIESRMGNAAAAEAAAARVIDLNPSDGRGPLALARARLAAGNFRGVVQALESRVADPTDDDVASGAFAEMAAELSRAFVQLDQDKRAVEVLERARRRLPSDEDLLYQLGAVYEEQRQFDRAERAFRELVQLNATHADALNYLGYMLADRGQKLPEAVEFITRALKVDPENPSYLDSLGWARFKLGQFDAAREPLEKAAAALPNSSLVQAHLGDLYVQLKRPSDAAAAFDRALEGDRDGVDVRDLTKKRDRARAAAGKS